MSKIIVTGGAGFVGSNLVCDLLGSQNTVIVLDNLSRSGTEKNIDWLRKNYSDRFNLVEGDIRNYNLLEEMIYSAEIVYHLAGQTAVTTSVEDPREDFEVNALGTLNVLEASRKAQTDPILIFTSTNKVYGGMEDVAVIETPTRYEYKDFPNGIYESQPLDFLSPYGCSKGAADQYVRDYARIYNLRTVVFRMSCIYGPRQFGNEDQGWVAHFVISSVLDRPITIFGDGKQVRDVLYIQDLLRAFDLAKKNIDRTRGEVYNIGGGKRNTLSLVELIRLLEQLLGRKVTYTFDEWRPGDQRVYVSDIGKAFRDFGWQPQISKEDGISRLFSWVMQNSKLFNKAEQG